MSQTSGQLESAEEKDSVQDPEVVPAPEPGTAAEPAQAEQPADASSEDEPETGVYGIKLLPSFVALLTAAVGTFFIAVRVTKKKRYVH